MLSSTGLKLQPHYPWEKFSDKCGEIEVGRGGGAHLLWEDKEGPGLALMRTHCALPHPCLYVLSLPACLALLSR